MRTMPKIIHADPMAPNGKVIDLPSIPATDWDAMVRRMIGRAVTEDEARKLDRMATAHWTARVAAEAILGHDLTTEEVTAAMQID